MARLSKVDWLEEGFKILSEFDQAKLKISYLCERLKVTRGSFYHHFSSIENYITELIKEWEQRNTLDFIKASTQATVPESVMEILSQKVYEADQSLEASIRSWSFYNKLVRQHLTKVDNIRLAFLQGIFEQMGETPERAAKKAKIEYSILIGIQQLEPNINGEEMEELYEVFRNW